MSRFATIGTNQTRKAQAAQLRAREHERLRFQAQQRRGAGTPSGKPPRYRAHIERTHVTDIAPLEIANTLSALPEPARIALAYWLRLAPERPSWFERLSRTPQAGDPRPDITLEQDAALTTWRSRTQTAVADRLAHLLAPLDPARRAALADVLENEPSNDIHTRVLQRLEARS